MHKGIIFISLCLMQVAWGNTTYSVNTKAIQPMPQPTMATPTMPIPKPASRPVVPPTRSIPAITTPTVGPMLKPMGAPVKSTPTMGTPTTMTKMPTGCYSWAKIEFSNAMRKLWEDHIVYTRLYLVSAHGNLVARDYTLQRLLQNQKDIGNAIVPYYGAEAGKKLTELLTEHISIAGKIIADLYYNKPPTDHLAEWDLNGEDIATFLASANPAWSLNEMKKMMQQHLDTTKTEVVNHFKKDWVGSITAYDAAHDMILEMADHLSMGIIKQFPEKFPEY